MIQKLLKRESGAGSSSTTFAHKSGAGFTLIEILVVIGIIAVLAAIVLVALNPARQFAQARQSQRSSNVNAILNAIGQYIADNQGNTEDLSIPDGEVDGALCDDLVPTYLPAMPTDPLSDNEGAGVDCSAVTGGGDVEYTVTEDADGRITVCASLSDEESALPDDDEEICVTR